MKKILIFLLLFSVLLANSTKTIKMGYRTTEKLPYIGENSDNSGFYFDLYNEAAKRIGYTLEVVRLPKVRVLQELEKGTIDFYPGFSFDEERAKYAYWIPIGYKQKDIAISLNSLKDLKTNADIEGLNYLVALGNPDYLQGFNLSKVNISTVPELDVERAIKLLREKRYDFYIYEEDTLLYYLNKNKIKGLKFHPNLLKDKEYAAYMGFSVNSPLWDGEHNPKYIPKEKISVDNFPIKPKKSSVPYLLNEAFNSMEKDGFTNKLREKYFAPYNVE